MVCTSGYRDPTFSLFNSASAHNITNDDSISLYSHLTQNLGTGVYTMLVSYCCSNASFANNNGGASSDTGGFNNSGSSAVR